MGGSQIISLRYNNMKKFTRLLIKGIVLILTLAIFPSIIEAIPNLMWGISQDDSVQIAKSLVKIIWFLLLISIIVVLLRSELGKINKNKSR